MTGGFITGLEIGVLLSPLWYAIVYAIDKLWEAFRPEGRCK